MPRELESVPKPPEEFSHYLSLFTLLRGRYSRTDCIPISEIIAAAGVYELPIQRSVAVVTGCDNAWLEVINRK